MDEHMDSADYLLRVTKYEGPQTKDAKIGINTHTDKNFVTLLHQNEVDGLEVQTKYGHWVAASPSRDSFVVVIGESFHVWTNGRLCATSHRVMISGEAARYSAGLFSVPKAGYIIKVPEEMVDEEHPVLYKPYDYVEFLKFYYTAEGQRAVSALKAYCGA